MWSIDPALQVMYVITEVAQYSLKDYFALKREKNKPLSRESIKACARAILLVVAGLHAKGLVHLDLKPENLMMFNGRLKLIDVDGCVPIGSEVSINDSSISFSPCYCAPEWARFLTDESLGSPSKYLLSPFFLCVGPLVHRLVGRRVPLFFLQGRLGLGLSPRSSQTTSSMCGALGSLSASS